MKSFALIPVLCVLLFGCGGGDSESSQSNLPSPGDTVILGIKNVSKVIVTRSVADMKEIQKYATANDEQGMLEVVLSGRAHFVDSGTTALFIDYGKDWGDPHEVRLLSGAYAREKVCVLRDHFIRKIGPLKSK